MDTEELKKHIVAVEGFPLPGVVFRDITPLLADGGAFLAAAKMLANKAQHWAQPFDIVAAVESRGFLFGAAVAALLGTGVAVIRKPGKLPRPTVSARYQLEYGESEVHLHKDAFAAFSGAARVLLVDDVLATGGTLAAASKAIAEAGGQVCGILCLVELPKLGGRAKLPQAPFYAPLQY
ncbi:MAG: adenine phosphoribosyltransferase [Gammaproteobacteria bacterium]